MPTPFGQRRSMLFLSIGFFALNIWPLPAQEIPEIIATFKGHKDTVYSVAMSPDGKTLATGSFDYTIKLWETKTGQEITTFAGPQGHQKMVLSVAFNNDGSLIASGSADNTLKIWEVPGKNPLPKTGKDTPNASLKPPRNFGHPNHVDAVAFQPGGNLLVSGCHDGKIRIFDLVKNAQIKEINAHPTPMAAMIYTLAFTPDGKQIVSAGYDKSLKLWDLSTGNLVREFKAYKAKEFEKGHQEGVFSVAFSPDGKLLASGSGGIERALKIWNVADGTVIRDLTNPRIKANPAVAHPGSVYNLRFTHDGKYLVSVGDAPPNKGYLALWDPSDGKLLFGESMSLGSFYGLAIAPDDQTLAIGAGSRGSFSLNFNNAYLFKMPKPAN